MQLNINYQMTGFSYEQSMQPTILGNHAMSKNLFVWFLFHPQE